MDYTFPEQHVRHRNLGDRGHKLLWWREYLHQSSRGDVPQVSAACETHLTPPWLLIYATTVVLSIRMRKWCPEYMWGKKNCRAPNGLYAMTSAHLSMGQRLVCHHTGLLSQLTTILPTILPIEAPWSYIPKPKVLTQVWVTKMCIRQLHHMLRGTQAFSHGWRDFIYSRPRWQTALILTAAINPNICWICFRGKDLPTLNITRACSHWVKVQVHFQEWNAQCGLSLKHLRWSRSLPLKWSGKHIDCKAQQSFFYHTHHPTWQHSTECATHSMNSERRKRALILMHV